MSGERAGRILAAFFVCFLANSVTDWGAPQNPGSDAAHEGPEIRITSPLGRTGLVGRVRIVVQVHEPAGRPGAFRVWFYVDARLIGTVDSPPYAVEWTDENPFERREIIAQAQDAAGRIASDTVVLMPFEVTDRTEVTSILLETGVYDKTGRFISGLAPDVFTVRENGRPQTIDQVARETLPTTLLLLVDNSQSMSRRMEFVQHAAERLAGALRRHDQVIVAPFNAHVGTITGPTNDAATISDAIKSMHAGGGTAIEDALIDATHLLERLDGRRAVILITDGYDENSTADETTALKVIESAQIMVYGVGIGGVAGISLKGEDLLRHLADATGGRVFFPPREPDLVAVSEGVAADAHSRYLITYTPADQKKDGSWREISVDAPQGYRVRTRAGYFAPRPPPIRPTIEFTMKNTSSQYVDIAREDLQVMEDGAPQVVDTFQEAVDPVAIVMALDSSGSMRKAAEIVRKTARDFVVSVRPEDSLALITFADVPLFAHVLATNRQWTLDAIDKYAPIGGTALYDALWNSLLHLRDAPARRAVVVLTDGRDENNPGTAPGSTHTLDDVLKLDRQVGATIYAIGLGTKVDASILKRLASESGGEAYFPTEATLLDGEFRQVVENLRRRYVLSYTSTNFDHDGGWRAVEIRPRSPEVVVVSRGGYFAPGP